MKIFKTKHFAKWCKKEKLNDKALIQAIDEIHHGLIDAKLGNFLYKKRIAVQDRGKRGSVRTILAFQTMERSFFIFGYAKNKKSDLTKKELNQLKMLASLFISYNDSDLEKALKAKEFIEVKHNE